MCPPVSGCERVSAICGCVRVSAVFLCVCPRRVCIIHRVSNEKVITRGRYGDDRRVAINVIDVVYVLCVY